MTAPPERPQVRVDCPAVEVSPELGFVSALIALAPTCAEVLPELGFVSAFVALASALAED